MSLGRPNRKMHLDSLRILRGAAASRVIAMGALCALTGVMGCGSDDAGDRSAAELALAPGVIGPRASGASGAEFVAIVEPLAADLDELFADGRVVAFPESMARDEAEFPPGYVFSAIDR